MSTRIKYNQLKESPSKVPCRVSTTENISNLLSGAPSSIDSISLSINDRILVKNQSTPSQNGIYTVMTVGGGSNGVWMRADDFSVGDDVYSGVSVYVSDGNINGGTIWNLSTLNPIVLDSTPITFTKFTGSSTFTTVSNGLTFSGSDILLGGTLSQQTSIDTDNNLFIIGNANPGVGGTIIGYSFGGDGKGGDLITMGYQLDGGLGGIPDGTLPPVGQIDLAAQSLELYGGLTSSQDFTRMQLEPESLTLLVSTGNNDLSEFELSAGVGSAPYIRWVPLSGTLSETRSIWFSLFGQDFTIEDSYTNKGLVYRDDYSSNFTDRSLVDEAYVLPRSGGTISGNFAVDGFSSIGSGSPAIKTKTVTITTGAPGSSDIYQSAHGLSASKVISFSAIGQAQDGSVVLSESTAIANSIFTANLNATVCRVGLLAVDTNMHNSDVIFYITYIE